MAPNMQDRLVGLLHREDIIECPLYHHRAHNHILLVLMGPHHLVDIPVHGVGLVKDLIFTAIHREHLREDHHMVTHNSSHTLIILITKCPISIRDLPLELLEVHQDHQVRVMDHHLAQGRTLSSSRDIQDILVPNHKVILTR